MGKKIAPANKNPHASCEKQKKMCVSHAKNIRAPKIQPITSPETGVNLVLRT